LHRIECPDEWAKVTALLESFAPGLSTPSPGLLRVPPDVDPAEVLAFLVRGGVRVREFRREAGSLETLYLESSREARDP
jgi:hypothetical protein